MRASFYIFKHLNGRRRVCWKFFLYAALLLQCAVVTSATSVVASPIRRVIVSGGTHGNEYTGVYVLEKLKSQSEILKQNYPSLEIETLLANPKAHAANRRFIDDDLNRMFAESMLSDISLSSYEANRAKAISFAIGPKGSKAAADFCVDLHTTTACMGCTIIVNEWCPLSIRAAAYISRRWSDACAQDGAVAIGSEGCGVRHDFRVMLHPGGSQAEAPYLCSVARNGLTIEIGPIPQGLLRSDVIASTERALQLVLEFLELLNNGEPVELPHSLRVYIDRGKVPWEAGHDGSKLPGAVVHHSLQDRDFGVLSRGDPLYQRVDGSVLAYDGSCGEIVHPVFVNEAAYYYAESGQGVTMTQCVEW
eukprot:CAMPEP_0119303702 /NCGR_PEP_ID=MMETSP1333-20130426/5092_1 /TAXON_ID=418940 /ORGANISM="Scyphosphaera apsteinii, Strain RCC1455" /LENGTH=362 /DNA_ID=CAMNT_0007306441 /DNA_START=68 /DNA_END=1153 /DNA_ORIENTATION=+